jgi:hypothetical protein
LDDVEEYFATCPWMNDFMDEKWMNFILNVANKCYFSRKLEKKKGSKQFMLLSFNTNPKIKC